MRRFVLQVLAFLFFQAALLGALLSRYDVPAEANYMAATVEKHLRLRSVPKPRVILVGGSNVAFGFASDQMVRALGRPVVNMGLAAGLGLEFMLREIESALGPGDLVVLSLEYEHFARGPRPKWYLGSGFDPNVLQQVLIFRPRSFSALGMPHFRKIVLDRGLAIAGEIARRALLFPTSGQPSQTAEVPSARLAFNEWGDMVGHRNRPSAVGPEVVDQGRLVGDARGFPNVAALEALREFVEATKASGVKVAFTFPPKPTGTMDREGAIAALLAGALRRIPGLILLDTPGDHTYPPELFFDSANHLTAEGTARRTAAMIDALRHLLR